MVSKEEPRVQLPKAGVEPFFIRPGYTIGVMLCSEWKDMSVLTLETLRDVEHWCLATWAPVTSYPLSVILQFFSFFRYPSIFLFVPVILQIFSFSHYLWNLFFPLSFNSSLFSVILLFFFVIRQFFSFFPSYPSILLFFPLSFNSSFFPLSFNSSLFPLSFNSSLFSCYPSILLFFPVILQFFSFFPLSFN